MSNILTLWRQKNFNSFTLNTELEKFEPDFEILYKREIDVKMKYLDIDAVIFMAKIISWEFPDFSVERCFASLKQIQEIIDKEGYFESLEHRFIIVAKNKE